MTESLPKPFPTAKVIETGTEAEIEWVICRAPLYGAINGYVRVPEDSGITEEILNDISVHGGITYGTDLGAEGGWIGFDTLHAGDWWPGDENHFHDDWCRHWTQEQVVEETKNLARQVSEILARPLPAAASEQVAPEQAHSTDDLARKILRSERRGRVLNASGDSMHSQRIEGMKASWEFLTGLDATEENLLAAEERAEHPLMSVSTEGD